MYNVSTERTIANAIIRIAHHYQSEDKSGDMCFITPADLFGVCDQETYEEKFNGVLDILCKDDRVMTLTLSGPYSIEIEVAVDLVEYSMPLDVEPSLQVEYADPVMVEDVLTGERTHACKDFMAYAKAMVLPDPTLVEISKGTNNIFTNASNILGLHITPWMLFRETKSMGFTEDGRETISFPNEDEAWLAVQREAAKAITPGTTVYTVAKHRKSSPDAPAYVAAKTVHKVEEKDGAVVFTAGEHDELMFRMAPDGSFWSFVDSSTFRKPVYLDEDRAEKSAERGDF